MKKIAIGVSAALLTFFVAQSAIAQTATSTPSPTTATTPSPTVAVPSGAPATGYGGV